MRQAAKHDLHTTEGLAQVQHLRFVLSSGEVDTQFSGMTIRGGVLDDGIREIPGSEIIDGRCALQLSRLLPRHNTRAAPLVLCMGRGGPYSLYHF